MCIKSAPKDVLCIARFTMRSFALHSCVGSLKIAKIFKFTFREINATQDLVSYCEPALGLAMIVIIDRHSCTDEQFTTCS